MSDDVIRQAIESLADGGSLDWSALDSQASSDEEREYLKCLRILGDIADVHRSSDGESTPGTWDQAEHPSIEFTGTERFAIERCLGSGAFGTVYQVYDRQRHGHVALKMLHRLDASALYRLKQEFRVLADLSHPNLASLYELLCEDGQWFILMELIAGCEFVQFVLEDPPPDDTGQVNDGTGGLVAAAASPRSPRRLGPSGVARLEESLRQLAEGLRHLHAVGILHRDIKPANVLVTPQGRVVLLDFGLATEFGTGREDTTNFGTPAYMSPEHGTAAGFIAASDWYSVGVMLFKALTGALPFGGSAIDVIAAKRQRDAPEPREWAPDVPVHLNDLCRDLLSRRPEARLAAADSLLSLGGPRESAQALAPAPARAPIGWSLVGRATHLKALTDAYDGAKAGRAITVYVHGGSGMGKTALVRRFLETVHERDRDAIVLSGRCFEQESVPYKALDGIVDALSRYLRGLPRTTTDAFLPRDVLALTRVFPVLRRVEAIVQARHRMLEVPDSQELRRRAFAAFRELLARMSSRHPLVLFVDDLQWGDADSAALLSELLRPPDPPLLLLVAAYRTEDAESSVPLRMLLGHDGTPARGSEVREVVVGELTPEDAGVLADRLLHDGTTAGAQRGNVVREAGGNPYLIAELVRFAKSSNRRPELALQRPLESARDDVGEIALDEMIISHVRQLPEPARRMLEVLAVFGQPLDTVVASQAAAIGPQELEVRALLRAERLSRTRISRDREEIETYHDRIRQTVVAHLSPEALRAHHQALALALESTAGADPDVLAVHFQGAGDRERATTYAIAAAERAGNALAFDRAARLYRLALDLAPADFVHRHAITVKRGDSLASAGRGREAAQAYLAAVDGATAATQLDLRRRAAEQLLRSGHLDEGYETIRVVLETMGMTLARSPRRALLSMLVRRAHLRLRGSRFRTRDVSQISPESLMRIDACWSVAMGLGIVDHVRGADFQARHMLLALSAGEPYRIARALAIEIAYASDRGGRRARRRVKKLSDVAQALADRVNHPQVVGLTHLARGVAADMQGRWKEAFERCESGEAILREQCVGVGWELAAAHLYSLLALSCLGEIGELSRRLPLLIQEARERNYLNAVVNLRTRLSYIACLAGDDVAHARAEVQQGISGWSQKTFTAQHYFELHGNTEIALFAGDGAAAWTAVEHSWVALERSLLLRVQRVLIEALSLRARAAVAAAVDDATGRKGFLQTADLVIGRIRKQDAPQAVPLADLIAAGCEVAREHPARAMALLETALQGFDAIDMCLHAAAARRRLGQLGRPGHLADADAWMRAHGISNPEAMTRMMAPGLYPTQ